MARRRSDVDWPSLEPVRSTRIYEEIVRQMEEGGDVTLYRNDSGRLTRLTW